jgi:hypothetical protein
VSDLEENRTRRRGVMRRSFLPVGFVLAVLAVPLLAADNPAKKQEGAPTVTVVDGRIALDTSVDTADRTGSGAIIPPADAASRRTPNCPLETCGTNCGSGCKGTGTQNDDDTGLTSCLLGDGVELICQNGKTVHEISNNCVNNCPPPPPLLYCAGRRTTSLVCE